MRAEQQVFCLLSIRIQIFLRLELENKTDANDILFFKKNPVVGVSDLSDFFTGSSHNTRRGDESIKASAPKKYEVR